ncbi:MAG: hypothetical protein GQ474_03195 [Sulfurimonas sp.]|nr:hypothetical protein [Sulfurimonas sp.]
MLLFFPFFLFADNLTYKLSYFKDTNSLELSQIKKQIFKPMINDSINMGYTTDDVWVKLEVISNLKNNLTKKLFLDNPSIDHLYFYENLKLKKHTGEHTVHIDVRDMFFSFTIEVEPKEIKEIYLKMNTSNALVAKFFLEDEDIYFKISEYRKIFLLFFFGFISSIIIYNLFLYFILRDKSTLFYVLFQMSILTFFLAFSGLGSHLFWYNYPLLNELILTSFDDLSIMFGLLFSQHFLNIKRYNKAFSNLITIMSVLMFYIAIAPSKWHYDYLEIIMISGIGMIFTSAIYGIYKKIPGAKIFFYAWFLLLMGALISIVSNSAFLNLYYASQWTIYIGMMMEAIIFSVALAKRIQVLKQEKEDALNISKEYLNSEVIKKTKYLDEALKEKEVLLREVHHRVKNNLQIISSFVTISSIKEKNKESKERYEVLNQRIQAISMLHDFFYNQENIDNINTEEYITSIVNNLNIAYNTSNKNIELKYNIIPCKIEFEKLVLVALIINELVTNSFKFAFKNKQNGQIRISFYIRHGCYYLAVRDNGNGFKFDLNSLDSIGLKIVHRLAQKQLDAKVDFKSNDKKTTFIFIFK